MNLFESEGNVYTVLPDGTCRPVDVKATDEVQEVRRLASVTVVARNEAVELPAGARPVTVEEVVAKFNVSERHPLRYRKPKAAPEAGQ